MPTATQTTAQTAIRFTARVQPGKRVEFSSPEFEEGEDVEVIVLKACPAVPSHNMKPPEPQGILEWLQSLPSSNLAREDWERIERELKEEKDAWDR